MKPISSVITTPRKAPSAPAGPQAGERGLTIPPSGNPSATQVAEITHRKPSENMEAAHLRLQDLGYSVSMDVASKWTNGQWTPQTRLMCLKTPAAQSSKAKQVCDQLLAPAPEQQIMAWLTECAVLTASTRDGEEASKIKLGLYAADLREFPADLVRDTLKRWPREVSKWFPDLKDLRDRLIAERDNREELARAVSLAVESAPVTKAIEPPEPDRPVNRNAEFRKICLDAMLPHGSFNMRDFDNVILAFEGFDGDTAILSEHHGLREPAWVKLAETAKDHGKQIAEAA